MEWLPSLFTDYTLRTVALGAMILGIVSGALGSFAVLRRQSLLGDAMAHAALPGVVITFMITGLKSPAALMAGAAVACVLGVLLVIGIRRATRIKEDSSLGIVLSVFFGFGLLLLSLLQQDPDARQAGLNKFLFGQAATMLASDLLVMAVYGGLALLLLLLFWKEFKLLSFDRDYAASQGFNVALLEVLLTFLLVIAIVIGLQAVGVVLMSAMVVAPAAAARQWTDRLGLMVALAGVFGALAGVAGTAISGLGAGLSTGPVIVLCVSLIVFVSLLLAPHRGLVWNGLARLRTHRRLHDAQVLENLYRMAAQHPDPFHPHAVEALRVMGGRAERVNESLRALAERGLVREGPPARWALTEEGLAEATRLLAAEGSQNAPLQPATSGGRA
jgi:manganese/zinc/iron transport system permease protein